MTLLGIAGAFAALFWLGLPGLAGMALEVLAQDAALLEPRFTVSRLGWRQAELAEARWVFQAESGTLAVDLARARLDYSLDWRHAVLHGVTIGQAKLDWRASPASPSGSGNVPHLTPFVLPFESLMVEHLELDAATGLGRSRFVGALEIEVRDGNIEARLSDHSQVARLKLAPSARQARLDVESSGGDPLFHAEAAQQPNGAVRARLDADGRTLLEWLAAYPLLPDTLRMRMGMRPELRQSLGSLTPRLTVALEADDASLRLHGRLLHGGQTFATLEAVRGADGVSDGELTVSAPALVAAALALPWLPTEAAPWWPQSGNVRGRAQLRLRDAVWTGTVDLEADGLALTHGALALADGRLRLTMADLPAGRVEFAAEVPSLRLGDKLQAERLVVRGIYSPNRLSVQEAGARLFGGDLNLVPVDIDLNQRPLVLTLRLADLDLAALLAILERDDLSGSGRIGGELPLRIDENGVEIDGGHLAGHGPGVLRYRGPATDPDNIAFKALRNLAYHTLQGKLDYRADGEYRIGLRLEGNNPELMDGYPVAFNLNLTGRLSELMRAGLLSGDWDRAILNEAEKQGRSGAP